MASFTFAEIETGQRVKTIKLLKSGLGYNFAVIFLRECISYLLLKLKLNRLNQSFIKLMILWGWERCFQSELALLSSTGLIRMLCSQLVDPLAVIGKLLTWVPPHGSSAPSRLARACSYGGVRAPSARRE